MLIGDIADRASFVALGRGTDASSAPDGEIAERLEWATDPEVIASATGVEVTRAMDWIREGGAHAKIVSEFSKQPRVMAIVIVTRGTARLVHIVGDTSSQITSQDARACAAERWERDMNARWRRLHLPASTQWAMRAACTGTAPIGEMLWKSWQE